jgi:hypothetical protein
VAPDFDHVDVVFWSIPKLLTVAESPNRGVLHRDLVRLTLVIAEMKFRGWMHRVGRQDCGSDREIWSVTMLRYKILGSPNFLLNKSLPDLKFSVRTWISVGLSGNSRGGKRLLLDYQMSP